MKMNPVVHFELPADDTKRMAAFYTKAFGWQAKDMGPAMGGYVVVTTTESDPTDLAGRPKDPGAINGGLYDKSQTSDPAKQHPSVVIAVDDLREAMKRIEAAGGTVIGGMKPKEPDDIPGVGLYIAFQDTEGNRLSILQPRGMG